MNGKMVVQCPRCSRKSNLPAEDYSRASRLRCPVCKAETAKETWTVHEVQNAVVANPVLEHHEPLFCSKCGNENDNNAFRCTRCGYVLRQPELPQGSRPMVCPYPYLVEAILLTILCFFPTGIAAIVYAARVKGAWARGNAVEAIEQSRAAKTWCVATFFIGLTLIAFFYLALASQ